LLFPPLYLHPGNPLTYQPQQFTKNTNSYNIIDYKKEKRKKAIFPASFIFFQICREIRVFIGFNFKPILSGEKSSGAMPEGLKGLLGLTLD
jgi:hypothetical protein